MSDSDADSVRARRPRLDEPGDTPVDVLVVCVVSRFGLHSPRHLFPTYLSDLYCGEYCGYYDAQGNSVDNVSCAFAYLAGYRPEP